MNREFYKGKKKEEKKGKYIFKKLSLRILALGLTVSY